MPNYGPIAAPSLNSGKEQLLMQQKEEASMVTAGGKRTRKIRHGGKTFNAPYDARGSAADNARLAELAETQSNISQMNKGTEVGGGGRRRRKTKYRKKSKSKRRRKTKSKRRRKTKSKKVKKSKKSRRKY